MTWRTVDFQNNKKTMEHSDHRIMTGWHGEQLDFQNNGKTMEHSDHWIMMTGWHGEQWIFKTTKRQWNILINGS